MNGLLILVMSPTTRYPLLPNLFSLDARFEQPVDGLTFGLSPKLSIPLYGIYREMQLGEFEI